MILPVSVHIYHLLEEPALRWPLLVAYRYPANIRKVIYTANAIESVHRQFRKLTKTKDAFPNESSLLKLLYLGLMNA